MTLEEFAGRIQKAKPRTVRGCRGYQGCCPAHEDANPSFAVWESADGWLHVNCQKGCTEGAILASLQMSEDDRRVEPKERKNSPETVYTYQDAGGVALFEKVRYLKGDKKSFFQRLPGASEPGVASLNGKSKTLYRLPRVLKAFETRETIYVNEGEKAVASFEARGYCATCQPGGADGGNPGAKWLDKHTQSLAGAAKVVVVADRDETGENYARYVAADLARVGVPVEIVQSATTGEKDDAFDHFAAGFTVDQFVRRRDLEPEKATSGLLKRASEIEILPVDWLFAPYIPKGMLSGVEGEPGVGKSMFAAAIAAALSTGRQLPWSDTPPTKGRSLLIHTEDSPSHVTVPRLQRLGADLSMVDIVEESFPLDDQGFAALRSVLEESRPSFVSIDPITAFLDATKATAGRAPVDVHGVLKRLGDLAAEFECAIVPVRHLKKSASGNPINDGIGEISIVGKYRSALQLRKDPEDKRPAPRVVVTHFKSNIGVKGRSFGYVIEPAEGSSPDNAGAFTMDWTGHTDETAESLAERALSRKAPKGAKREEDAAGWLVSVLSHGPVPSDRIFAEGADQGVSRNAIFEAKKKNPSLFQVRKAAYQGGWEWFLSEAVAPRPDQGGDGDDYDVWGDR